MPLDQGNWAEPRKIAPAELRRRLDAEGYDTAAIDKLGLDLKVDLLAILAGWAPVLEAVMRPEVPILRGETIPVALPLPRPKGRWRRFWDWLWRK